MGKERRQGINVICARKNVSGVFHPNTQKEKAFGDEQHGDKKIQRMKEIWRKMLGYDDAVVIS